MTQDATKVMLGATTSSIKDVTAHAADPASFPAGIAVRQKTDGGLLIADNSTAALLGVSLGASLSDTKKTAVARTGNEVPILLDAAGFATVTIGDLTFTALEYGDAGNDISVTLADGNTAGAATVQTDPDAPLAILVSIEDGVTTAAAIKTAMDAHAGTAALISVTIADGETATAQAAATETALEDGDDTAILGAVVELNVATGYAKTGGTSTGAIYVSGVLTGVYSDGTTAPCALINMIGGL